jgi:hypothetical protein
MSLNTLYDFIQLLLSKRKHLNKDEYFSQHIIFTMIYLL